MTKAGFWKTDWFLGVAVVISVVLFNRLSDLIPGLERKAYDRGVAATSRGPSDKTAVISIDGKNLANLDRWPWSRYCAARCPLRAIPWRSCCSRSPTSWRADNLSIGPDLPPALVAFLDKAMAKYIDQRCQTGEEFAAALRAAFGCGASPAAGRGSVVMDISL